MPSPSELAEERSVGTEALDIGADEIADKDRAVGVDGDAKWREELPVAAALRSPRGNEVTGAVEFLDTEVAHIGHVEAPVRRESDIAVIGGAAHFECELPVPGSGCPPG